MARSWPAAIGPLRGSCWDRVGMPGSRSGAGRGVLLRGREGAAEGRAGATRHETQLAAHLTGELTPDRETEAEAPVVAGFRAALEALEDPLLVVGRDAGAGVRHLDGGARCVDAQDDVAVRPGVVVGVVEQDARDPGDDARVRLRPHRP